MSFWENVNTLNLQEVRPGIKSKAELGERLIVALMEIGPGMEDKGHRHPFEQLGIVTQGEIKMFVENERRVLKPMDAYFIPAGAFHGWKRFDKAGRIPDVTAKTGLTPEPRFSCLRSRSARIAHSITGVALC
jgi:mannose-6-phosphate isomerase-like protein (cupin superfamily)